MTANTHIYLVSCLALLLSADWCMFRAHRVQIHTMITASILLTPENDHRTLSATLVRHLFMYSDNYQCNG